MQCPRCGTDNLRDSRYCRRCSTALGGSVDHARDAPVPASRTARLLAWLIDLPLSPAVIVLAMFLAESGGAGFVTLPLLVLGAAGIPYQAALLTREGQTIGQRAMRLRIVRSDNGLNGRFMTNVVLRYGVNWLLCLIPPYILIDAAFILTANRRCIHDYLAGTIVIVDAPRTYV